ncbi:MAG: hypothetical protein IPG72_14645 [Ardenticatenales bacterium]|nr:hypothetical protein [Ardenticatenales bacterium]
MFNEFIRFGLWPVTIVAVSLLAAGVWRMNVRLAAVGVGLGLPLCAYLFIAGPGGLVMVVLLIAGGAMALMGVRAGDRVTAWGGAAVVALIVGFLAWIIALSG